MKLLFSVSLCALLSIIFVLPANAFSPDDSLLFDGAYGKVKNPRLSYIDCKITVKFALNSVEATKFVAKTYEVCGVVDTGAGWEKGIVVKDDILKIGEEIITGPDSWLSIELADGSEIKLGPDSKIVVTNDFCTEKPNKIQMIMGDMWIKVKKLLGEKKYNISTQGGHTGVRGTEFTVHSGTSGGYYTEIIKVYEGSVEVYSKTMANVEDFTAKIKELQEELKNGKITPSEFQQKLKDLNDKLKNQDPSKAIVVNSGNKLIIAGSVTGPEPIESDDDRWFENAVFNQ